MDRIGLRGLRLLFVASLFRASWSSDVSSQAECNELLKSTAEYHVTLTHSSLFSTQVSSSGGQYAKVSMESVKRITAIEFQLEGISPESQSRHSSQDHMRRSHYGNRPRELRRHPVQVYYSVDGFAWRFFPTQKKIGASFMGCDDSSISDDSQPSNDASLKLSGCSKRNGSAHCHLHPSIKARYIITKDQSLNMTDDRDPMIRLFGCPLTHTINDHVTYITQDISNEAIWTLSMNPVVISRSVYVWPSGQLTIKAGVQIIFNTKNAGIVVQGRLLVKGKPGLEVRFSGLEAPFREDNRWLGLRIEHSGDLVEDVAVVDSNIIYQTKIVEKYTPVSISRSRTVPVFQAIGTLKDRILT